MNYTCINNKQYYEYFRSELVTRVKYNNTLPDIPFDPKFITYPFESSRYDVIQLLN